MFHVLKLAKTQSGNRKKIALSYTLYCSKYLRLFKFVSVKHIRMIFLLLSGVPTGCQDVVEPCMISQDRPAFIKGTISVNQICDNNLRGEYPIELSQTEEALCSNCAIFSSVYGSPTFFNGNGRFTIYGYRNEENLRNDSLFFEMFSVGQKSLANPENISEGFIFQFRDIDAFGEPRVTSTLWGDQLNSKIEVTKIEAFPWIPESTVGYGWAYVRFTIKVELYYESGTYLGLANVETLLFMKTMRH